MKSSGKSPGGGNGAQPVKSGSKGNDGPSMAKESCASNAGPARVKGGVTTTGNTHKGGGAREQCSGSRGG